MATDPTDPLTFPDPTASRPTHIDPGEMRREIRRDPLDAQNDCEKARALFRQRLAVAQNALTQLDLAWQMLPTEDQQRIIEGLSGKATSIVRNLESAFADLPEDFAELLEAAAESFSD